MVSPHAAYISLADKLTESPITEYSLRDPLVPTTPVNTHPVPIPNLLLQLILANSSFIVRAVIMALEGSSYFDIGNNPNTTIKVEPLSSINNLFKEP